MPANPMQALLAAAHSQYVAVSAQIVQGDPGEPKMSAYSDAGHSGIMPPAEQPM